MNEIQIIQSQLETERLHFAEVANACAAALGNGSFAAHSDFAAACADYFAFAVTRLAWNSKAPGPGAPEERWREFLRAFSDQAAKHFGALEPLLTRNLPVTQWRALSRIDADSIFTERACYGRVKAAVP
jgi:hypothetical protein